MEQKKDFHLLFVENSRTARMVMTKFLEEKGYQVTTVENGQQAISTLESTEPIFHLVIMDVFMPTMNGPEAAAKIRKLENAHAQIPILALSSSQNPTDKTDCLKAGMSDFIQKTNDNVPLLMAIEKHRLS